MANGFMIIRTLTVDDISAYIAARQRSLLDAPLALTASPDNDVASNADFLRENLRRAPDWTLFGAFFPDLGGIAGLARDRHRKRAHITTLWGFWVAPEHRRGGVATALLNAVIEHARSIEGVEAVHLSVSSGAPGAKRLYERAGFVQWGIEPDALRHEGKSEVEQHMVLHLR